MRLQSKGTKLFSRSFIFIFAKNSNTKQESFGSRLGIIASKKVGNAVARNRWKRLFREVFIRVLLPANKDLDFIFIAKKANVKITLAILVAELKSIAEKNEIL